MANIDGNDIIRQILIVFYRLINKINSRRLHDMQKPQKLNNTRGDEIHHSVILIVIIAINYSMVIMVCDWDFGQHIYFANC